MEKKAKILEDFTKNECGGKTKRVRCSKYDDIDKAVFTWFSSVRTQNLPVSGPLVKEKAAFYAEKIQ